MLAFRAATLAGLAIVVAACDSGSSGPVREWTPADHDPPLANQAPQVAGRASNQPSDDASLIELAWTRNCARCHGQRGRGDGPESAMVRAPDLTRPDWLASVTDQQMLEVI